MDIVQFIGFLISVLAIMVIMGRKSRNERQRRQHPEQYMEKERKQKELLKQVMHDLGMDVEKEEEEEEEVEELHPAIKKRVAYAPPPGPDFSKMQTKAKPHIPFEDKYAFKDRFDDYHTETAIEKRRFKTAIEERNKFSGEKIVSPEYRHGPDAYTIRKRDEVARGTRVIGSLHSRKEMVILHEIIDKPKALKRYFQ